LTETAPPSIVALRLDPSNLRQWHLRLIERLERDAHRRVQISWGRSVSQFPSATGLLFEVEQIVHGIAHQGPMKLLERSRFEKYSAEGAQADITIDLCGDMTARRDCTVWQLSFDGGCGEGSALNSLVHGIPPYLELRELRNRRVIASAHPGTEHPGIMVLALADVMVRTTTLILAAVRDIRVRTATVYFTPNAGSNRDLLKFAAKSLARTIAVRLYHLCYNTPHWKVGWNLFSDKPVAQTGQHPANGWNTIPDNGRRFYADPFPLYRDGKYQIFVEDFDHRLGYGVVSSIEVDERGKVGPARVVLDTGSHLSYPFIFEAEGEVWMMPESSTVNRLELYRAVAYPDKWELDSVLLDNVEISDATIFEHEGEWWMMATVRDEGGNYSDTLMIWTAAHFRGPWLPLPSNPVLIDVACARPAGHIIKIDGALVRPVQDCTICYGGSIAFAQITRLDDTGFSQNLGARLTAGPQWSGRRLHTYNISGRLETIDGSSVGRKFF